MIYLNSIELLFVGIEFNWFVVIHISIFHVGAKVYVYMVNIYEVFIVIIRC